MISSYIPFTFPWNHHKILWLSQVDCQAAEGEPVRASCRDGEDAPRAMLSEGDILGPGRCRVENGDFAKNHGIFLGFISWFLTAKLVELTNG